MPPRQSSFEPLDGIAETLDRASYAAIAIATRGLSPATLMMAAFDWGLHLTLSPGKRLLLRIKLIRKHMRLFDYFIRNLSEGDAALAIEPLPQDRRFSSPQWRRKPYNLIHQAFLLNQQWWHAATTNVSGVSKRHEDMVTFAA